MRKALLFRFIGVLFLALAISSGIDYYFLGQQLLANNIESLANIVHVVDYAMDYDKNLQKQLSDLHQTSFDNNTRVTIIDKDGVVFADSAAEQPENLENHLSRKEIQEAIRTGKGYATRYSNTLEKNMLYVAEISEKEDYIIRISIPYKGIRDYIRIVFPMLILGIGVAFLISVVVTMRFTNTITQPLREISDKMQVMHGNDLTFEQKTYQYEELNIISDTTSKLTRDIQAYIDKLEFEKKIRQEFFSNASHELKTPITSVKGYAELLEAGFVKDEVTKKDFIARIRKETENMTTLINDILMISRLETKEAEVTFSMVRMAPLLKEIFETLETQAMECEVTLHSECEPIVIEASTKQLRELIMNLVTNGIKYNHPGGNVWVRVQKKEPDMVIEVTDDGMGIALKDKERVFERFYRADKGRSKKMGGTGLGLAIVKHIVEYYGGTIQLESVVEQGSKFTIKIPMKREETAR